MTQSNTWNVKLSNYQINKLLITCDKKMELKQL